MSTPWDPSRRTVHHRRVESGKLSDVYTFCMEEVSAVVKGTLNKPVDSAYRT